MKIIAPITTVLLLVFATAFMRERKQTHPTNIEPSINFEAHDLNKSPLPGDSIRQLVLRISLTNSRADLLKLGIQSPEQHQERLLYYISDFKEQLSLESEGSKLSCLDSHLERTHMDLPYRNFILTFTGPDVYTHKTLKVEDPILTNRTIEIQINS